MREVVFPDLFPEIFFDVDLVTRGLGKTGEEHDLAYKRARETVDNYIREDTKRKESFGIESTFISETRIRMIKDIVESGYEGLAVVLHTENSDLNQNRIFQRETEGGHGISKNVVSGDHEKIISNVQKYSNLFQNMIFIDNSENPLTVAIRKEEKLTVFLEERNAPRWFEPILRTTEQVEINEEGAGADYIREFFSD